MTKTYVLYAYRENENEQIVAVFTDKALGEQQADRLERIINENGYDLAVELGFFIPNSTDDVDEFIDRLPYV